MRRARLIILVNQSEPRPQPKHTREHRGGSAQRIPTRIHAFSRTSAANRAGVRVYSNENARGLSHRFAREGPQATWTFAGRRFERRLHRKSTVWAIPSTVSARSAFVGFLANLLPRGGIHTLLPPSQLRLVSLSIAYRSYADDENWIWKINWEDWFPNWGMSRCRGEKKRNARRVDLTKDCRQMNLLDVVIEIEAIDSLERNAKEFFIIASREH